MSIDRRPVAAELRQDGAARMRPPGRNRYRSMLAAPEAAEIARTLTEKYGSDALAFARDRAARAVEIGDDLALGAWQSVIEATQTLLDHATGV